MSLLQTLGSGQGFLKAGFLGFPKSGKTWTAMLLATGTRNHFALDGPIAMFDTEGGSEYVAAEVRKRTGKDLIGVRSRALDDLVAMARECETAGVSVLVADSMTHVWRETCDSYLKQINARNERTGRSPQLRLEFQDWNPIKAKWNTWTDLYLNSKLHIVICGRAGYDWDFEENESTGKKELVKTGVKMKTEGEFGFEPSLLVEMERVQARDGTGAGARLTKEWTHRATILGDRFDAIDGASCEDPTFDFFRPHVERLTPGAHAPVNTDTTSDYGITDDGANQFNRERKACVILCEKIQAAMVERWPGQSTSEKKAKVAALKEAFGTASWTEVETRLKSDELKAGLARIEAMTANHNATEAA
jgi:hypothetical protein